MSSGMGPAMPESGNDVADEAADVLPSDPPTAQGCSVSERVEYGPGVTTSQIVFGKYYSLTPFDGAREYRHSTMFLHYPTDALGSDGVPAARLPFIFEIHGGGFTWGSATEVGTAFRKYTQAGFAVISLDYRVVTTDYFYNDAWGNRRAEELIEIDADGRMSLATDGRVMKDWAILGSRTEHATKCVFDAVVAMDHLVDNAELLGLDTERVSFQTVSAGSMAANYLIWSYPFLRPGRYAPRAAVFRIAQFDYPVQVRLSHPPFSSYAIESHVC